MITWRVLRPHVWRLPIVVLLGAMACGTTTSVGSDRYRSAERHPSIDRPCPSVAAARPSDSCLPADFTGNLVQTNGRLRAYEMCKRGEAGTLMVDETQIIIERPGSSSVPPELTREMAARAQRLFPDFATSGSCFDPAAPRSRIVAPVCLSIGVRTEHPTIDFLFHESENVMAVGDVSSCILLQIGAGRLPPMLMSTDD
jgi:hypothetical protein